MVVRTGLAALLMGCGSAGMVVPVTPVVPPVAPSPITGSYNGMAFDGKVLVGGVGVVGASVQLYAAGVGGNGAAAGFLLPSAVTTVAGGKFTVPAGYSCPMGTTQVYLVAKGGSVSAGASNGALAFVTALGSCKQVTAGAQVTVNEVNTVAAAWALAQFIGPGGIGATATNATGLANAFLLAGGLASVVGGVSPGGSLGSKVTSPAARVNTLANLLNPCAKGDGATSGSSPCGQLFAAATVGGVTPANTLDAVVAVVQHPGQNVAALYGLAQGSTAYAPVLPAPPGDWTLALTISGGGMNGPATAGVLAGGNVWVSNYFGVASQFTPLGVPVFANGITGAGLDHSYGLAVDAADNVWIGNVDKSTVTELASTGTPLSGAAGYSGGAISFPLALAIDPDGSVWVVDYGNAHLTRLSASGVPLSGSAGYASSQIAFPVALAIDAQHNAWVANSAGTTVTRVSQDGATVASAACCDGPEGVAIDQRGYVWVTNFYGNSVSLISSGLGVVSSGYPAAALNRPQGIAVDGAGNVWVASFRGAGVVEMAGTQAASPGTVLSPAAGWAREAPLVGAYSVAIDASGNVWVASFGSSTMTEIVGVAAPVKVPGIGPVQAP